LAKVRTQWSSRETRRWHNPSAFGQEEDPAFSPVPIPQ
jgi:hypothetical protein